MDGFGYDVEDLRPPIQNQPLLSSQAQRSDHLPQESVHRMSSGQIGASCVLIGSLCSILVSSFASQGTLYRQLTYSCCDCGTHPQPPQQPAMISPPLEIVAAVGHWLWMASPVVMGVLLVIPEGRRLAIMGWSTTFAVGAILGVCGYAAVLLLLSPTPACCMHDLCIDKMQTAAMRVLVVLSLFAFMLCVYLSSRKARHTFRDMASSVAVVAGCETCIASPRAEALLGTRVEVAEKLHEVLPEGPSMADLHAASCRSTSPSHCSTITEAQLLSSAALAGSPIAAEGSVVSPARLSCPPPQPLALSQSRQSERASPSSPSMIKGSRSSPPVSQASSPPRSSRPSPLPTQASASRSGVARSITRTRASSPDSGVIAGGLCDSATQTVWRRPFDDFGAAEMTECTALRHDLTAERFDQHNRSELSLSPIPTMNVGGRGGLTEAVGVQTLLTGPSPFSGVNPPSSWRPPVKRTRDAACQYQRPRAAKQAQPEAEKSTRDVGVQSFIPALKPTPTASKKPKPGTNTIGCGPGPWQWTSSSASEQTSSVSTPHSWLRSSLHDRSPRLPRVTLVFYNARTSYSSAPTPRRVTHSASLGQASVDAMEPTSFYCPLPGVIDFYVCLRTAELPPLTGIGWRAPIQRATGYASRRTLIWPTAILEFDKVVGREVELDPSRLRDLQVIVPGSYTYGGQTLNPTLEAASHVINLESSRLRQVHDGGTTRINIPLTTKPRVGLEEAIGELRPKAPPAPLLTQASPSDVHSAPLLDGGPAHHPPECTPARAMPPPSSPAPEIPLPLRLPVAPPLVVVTLVCESATECRVMILPAD